MSPKYRMTFYSILCLGLALHLLPGCASVKVKRTDVSKKTDISGSWNDTDSRLVAQEMIKDSLASPWISAFQAKNNTQPTVIVGTVINKTSEHIDAGTFVKNLEKNLLDSGSVKFVAAKQERRDIREERADQQTNASRETAKPLRQETGADFMLQGTISSIKDEVKGRYAIYYQINLELVNLATNEKAWIGQKEIKKIISRSAFGL
jgi:uncharacterized protein (TIGR02722 family)